MIFFIACPALCPAMPDNVWQVTLFVANQAVYRQTTATFCNGSFRLAPASMSHSAPRIQRYFLPLFLLVAAAVWLLAVGAKQTETTRYIVPQVSVTEAKAMIDAGALVIDVRAKAVSEYRHIQGALLLPLALLRAGLPPSLTAHKTQRIVVYCGDGVNVGPEATHLLRQAGYANAVNMTQGYSGWTNAKLPVIKS